MEGLLEPFPIRGLFVGRGIHEAASADLRDGSKADRRGRGANRVIGDRMDNDVRRSGEVGMKTMLMIRNGDRPRGRGRRTSSFADCRGGDGGAGFRTTVRSLLAPEGSSPPTPQASSRWATGVSVRTCLATARVCWNSRLSSLPVAPAVWAVPKASTIWPDLGLAEHHRIEAGGHDEGACFTASWSGVRR